MFVVPDVSPCTIPPALTVATLVLLLLQLPVPTPLASVNVVVEAGHTVYVPLIVPAFGAGFTVTTE